MEPFKNVLVGLDTSEMDATLVRFASFMADHTSAEKITFVNMVKRLNIPSSVRKEFPDLEENALKDRKEKMKAVVKEHFHAEKKVKIIFQVKKGQAPAILEIAHKSQTDLIIVGQKKSHETTGVTTLRLARRANCNLLIVPDNAVPNVDKLLVPIDFSNYAKLAVDQTIDFAIRTGVPSEIICQNVYAVPAGYHYTGKTFEEFGEIMKKNAQDNFQKFIKKIDKRGLTVRDEYALDTNDNLASDIYDLADSEKVGFVIIGAKGRTAAAALFLGSLAEQMVNEKMNQPLLVVRYKGKNAGIIESLREI
ncbi:universal stress protein [Fulvivirga maritima]|uniref:universal stress protein n=1 Tax=Fulvivirga maritima TaxID=2904247 RepID=UPI001F252D17|nr:universal stress protein [Fulvivirga maritima]UII25615.1 universal stress protein [Fulvivirga maritima]